MMDALERKTAIPEFPVSSQAVRKLGWIDLGTALVAGWNDFRAMPRFGLFFGGVYALAGLAIVAAALGGSDPSWAIPAMAGFPLLGPFIAVGLYQASKIRASGMVPSWRAVLAAPKGYGDDQIFSMGVIVIVGFAFWMICAHAVLAAAMPGIVIGMTGWDASLAFPIKPGGGFVLLAGATVGGLMVLAFFAMTVMSLPMLIERKIDFISAIAASLRIVRANLLVMLGWATMIAGLLFLAMLPGFLGLPIVLPLLGHTTWHLYRRAMP